MSWRIEVDDLSRPQVRNLLLYHFAQMREYADQACGECACLSLCALKDSSVTVYSVWTPENNDGNSKECVGCGAVQELDSKHGELKSIRTAQGWERRGIGRLVVEHILQVARERGYQRISLETASTEPFQPALRLYESLGFQKCLPFGPYLNRYGEIAGACVGLNSTFNVYYTMVLEQADPPKSVHR